MDDQHLKNENRTLLASITASIFFPYIWIGLIAVFVWLYQANFFGANGGNLVAALACLGLCTPVVPGAITRMVVRPLVSNLLGSEVVTNAGCFSGLVTVFAIALAIIFFLGRNLELALILFLTIPVGCVVVAGSVSLITKGSLSLPNKGRSQVPSLSVTSPKRLPSAKSESPKLLNDGTQTRLPDTRSPSSTQLPTSRPPSRRDSNRRPNSDQDKYPPQRPGRRQ